MAIVFSSAPGNLFNALGKIGALIKNQNAAMVTQKTSMINTTTGVVAQFVNEPDIQAIMGESYIGILSAMDGASSGTAQSLASALVNRIVFRDNPRINQTLTSINTLASLQEIIRQMKAQTQSVLAMTVTSASSLYGNGSSFTGTGTGIINSSVKRPVDGVTLENSFAELIQVLCTSDSYSGGATVNNEGFTLTGTGGQTDLFAFNWPLGSNATSSLNAIDGDTSNGSGNVLTNSGFATFVTTPNVPDNWTLTVGAAGTNIAQNGGIVYGSGSSVQIIGDGSNLTSFQQQFNVSTGTSAALTALTQYSVNLYMRRDGVAAGAGTLTVDLVDGVGNVIKDANGVSNTFNIDLTALTTTFASFPGVFRTPLILPSTINIRYRLSTALTNGRSVYMSKTSMGLMTQLGTGSPYLAVHAGNVPFVQGDYGTVTVTNSRGAGGTLSTFQTLMYQLFPEVVSNEILLPSSASPTISDALIA